MKKIKYILFSFFFLFPLSVWAQNGIDVSISNLNPNLGENFILTISVNETNSGGNIQIGGTAEIPGIENFSVFSQKNGNKIVSVNGQTSIVQQFEYELSPSQWGDFTIGPVVFHGQNGDIEDTQTFHISVGGNAGSISQIPSQQGNQNNISSGVKNISNTAKDIDISQMKDIKRLSFPSISFGILLLGILGSLFFLFKGIFISLAEKKSEMSHFVPEKNISEEGEKSAEKKFLSKIEALEKNISGENIHTSLVTLNEAFRDFFKDLGFIISQGETLEESKKNQDLGKNKYFSFYESSYFAEYQSEKINQEECKKIIFDIKNQL